jgi:hypothetical protein
MKARNEIDAIKDRINDAILILPGYTSCGRCHKAAHITRKVLGDWVDLPVCLNCSNEAKELGLVVEEL